MRIPSNSPMTPGYGFGSTLPPYSPASPHKGVDFQHIPDDIIYAPFSGKVIHGYNDRDGNGTYMYDANGDFHGMLHASKYLVADGAQVSEGQPIAVMGETGLAEGVHLHWCVKRNNVFIDPMTLIEGEDMGRIEELEQIANDRQAALVKVAATVSVQYKDFNDLPQVIANIKNEQGRIDQLTEIVSKPDVSAAQQIEQIKKIVNG